MKITCFATFLLLQGSQAFAPLPSNTRTTSLVVVQLQESKDGWFGPAAAAMAGWAFAANVALAGNPLVVHSFGK